MQGTSKHESEKEKKTHVKVIKRKNESRKIST